MGVALVETIPTTAGDGQRCAEHETRSGTEIKDVKAIVAEILASQYGGRSSGYDRRRDRRYPYPELLRLTPVGRDGRTPSGPSIVVVGKNLSAQGIDFYHRDPLPYRRMIATLEHPSGQSHSMLIDLLWCRFNRHGWYDNGGRFVQVDKPPLVEVPESK